MKIVVLSLVVTLIVVVDVGVDAVATLNETFQIVDTSEAVQSWFGYSLHINRNTIVVGSYLGDKDGKESVGSISVYKVKGSSVQLTDKLKPREGQVGDYFGHSITSNGKHIVIGSSGDDETYVDQGSVYIYHYNDTAWTYKKVVARDGEPGDYFGMSVGLNDNNDVVVGAPLDEGRNSGSAYVFTYNGNGWLQTQKLIPNDLTAYSYFGASVALTTNHIAVGAYGQNYNNSVTSSGAVYMYKKNTAASTWYQHAVLRPSHPNVNGYFGWSVSMYGRRVVIGEDWNTGKVYVYTSGVNNTWALETTLTASDGKTGDMFGYSVSIHQDTIVIGARHIDKGNSSGSAYVFTLIDGMWKEITKLHSSDREAGDLFGFAVGVFNGDVVVGSPHNNASGKNIGAAYLYKGLTAYTTATTTTLPQATTTTTTIIAIIVPIVLVVVVIIVAILWRKRNLCRRQNVENNDAGVNNDAISMEITN